MQKVSNFHSDFYWLNPISQLSLIDADRASIDAIDLASIDTSLCKRYRVDR